MSEPAGERSSEPATGTAAVIEGALTEGGLDFSSPQPGAYLVSLPGTHKLVTGCWLVVGQHSLLVEAFVMRRPDEGFERLYNLLLTRNTRTYAVSWALDGNGDVFLVGRLPLGGITADEVDRILGSVLTYADTTFDLLLELGFASSIRREWEWRSRNGESLANLAAFARFADPARD